MAIMHLKLQKSLKKMFDEPIIVLTILVKENFVAKNMSTNEICKYLGLFIYDDITRN